jgi:hypothetical protein
MGKLGGRLTKHIVEARELLNTQPTAYSTNRNIRSRSIYEPLQNKISLHTPQTLSQSIDVRASKSSCAVQALDRLRYSTYWPQWLNTIPSNSPTGRRPLRRISSFIRHHTPRFQAIQHHRKLPMVDLAGPRAPVLRHIPLEGSEADTVALGLLRLE